MAIFETMDDSMICIEIIFENGEVPFEREYVGNVRSLTEALSEKHLKSRAEAAGATSAFVQNIYFKSKQEKGNWRMESRVGNQSDYDVEAVILKGEEE